MTWEDYEKKVDSKNQVKVKIEGKERTLKGWDAVVYLSLTLPSGYELYFWEDGEVTFLPLGETPSSFSKVVAVYKVPGIENIDQSVYTDGFLWNEEEGGWVDQLSDEKRVLKSFKELIAYLIEEVGLLEEEEELKKEVRESFLEKKSVEREELGETEKRAPKLDPELDPEL